MADPSQVQRCVRLEASSALCSYSDADHLYRLGGELVPSVTQVLTLSGAIDGRFFNEQACERGRQVHALCEILDRGAVPIAGSDAANTYWQRSEVGGYLDAYRAFLVDARPVYDAIEQAFWHRVDRYGGRPDRGCRKIFGHRGTLELKTGSEAAWHGLQLAGYERLRPRGARWVCYLEKTGRYKVRQITRIEDHRDFLERLADVRSRWAQLQTSMQEARGRDGDTRNTDLRESDN